MRNRDTRVTELVIEGKERSPLGRALIRTRLDKGLTTRDASKLTGVHFQTISRAERGDWIPSERCLAQLARGYGLEISLLKSLVEKSKEWALPRSVTVLNVPLVLSEEEVRWVERRRGGDSAADFCSRFFTEAAQKRILRHNQRRPRAGVKRQ